VCDVCGDTDLTWKKFYQEYLLLYRKRENWSNKKHQISCVIGFFCFCYKQFYGVDYIFVPQNINPYSCKECRDAILILKAFSSADIARKYIYWFFNKFLHSSIEISSLGYLNSPSIVRKYNLYRARNQSLRRSSSLPPQLIEWCKNNIPEIFNMYSLDTMNDLGGLLKYYNSNSNLGTPERVLISKAKEMKLISGNRLNIKE